MLLDTSPLRSCGRTEEEDPEWDDVLCPDHHGPPEDVFRLGAATTPFGCGLKRRDFSAAWECLTGHVTLFIWFTRSMVAISLHFVRSTTQSTPERFPHLGFQESSKRIIILSALLSLPDVFDLQRRRHRGVERTFGIKRTKNAPKAHCVGRSGL